MKVRNRELELHFSAKIKANYSKFLLNIINNFLLIIIKPKFLTKEFYIMLLFYYMIHFRVNSVAMHKFNKIYYIYQEFFQKYPF